MIAAPGPSVDRRVFATMRRSRGRSGQGAAPAQPAPWGMPPTSCEPRTGGHRRSLRVRVFDIPLCQKGAPVTPDLARLLSAAHALVATRTEHELGTALRAARVRATDAGLPTDVHNAATRVVSHLILDRARGPSRDTRQALDDLAAALDRARREHPAVLDQLRADTDPRPDDHPARFLRALCDIAEGSDKKEDR